ncbi:MAG: hypothetical protein EAX95_04940 [Candidatus Thorarchaeota archaeon]|nr:hypothetical protein [Candidatus Thorarchaeota archaeon]
MKRRTRSSALLFLLLTLLTSLLFNQPSLVARNPEIAPLSPQNSTEDAIHFGRNTVDFAVCSTNSLLGGDLVVVDSGYGFDGYNLFVVQKMYVSQAKYEEYLVITDMAGNAVLEKKLGNGLILADHPAEFINSTHILLATRTGAAFYDIVTDTFYEFAFSGHHEYEYNTEDNTIFTFQYNPVVIEESTYVFDRIVEFDLAGNLVWSLDTSTFISPDQWCPFSDSYPTGPDITHSNTIFYDEDEDVVYYNSRNTNTFYKINHTTGDVIWGVGEYGDYTMFNLYGVERDSLFYHAHSVEKVDDNTYILFDNDLHNQTDASSRASQILEITVDDLTMTANVTWAWTAPKEYWTLRWGDADRLPNGGKLGTFGTEMHPDTDLGARLVEVDDSGRIVWEMSFLNSDDVDWGIYRSERIRFKPTLSSPDDMMVLDGDSAVVSWDAWYNFRPKRSMPGSYDLYLNDLAIDSGSFEYDKYWRPEPLAFDLGVLSAGHNNVTLVVQDESGNAAMDTLDVFVGDFAIQRSGDESVELGASNTMLRWRGITSTALHCNITGNTTLLQNFTWTGFDFLLDLSLLEIGSQQIHLGLYDSFTLVYEESFWVDVHSMAAPSASIEDDYYSVSWNQSVELVWDIYDTSPFLWRVYLDDTLLDAGVWTNPAEQVAWQLPLLDEDKYHVRLVLEDRLALTAISEVDIIVHPPHPAVIVSGPSSEPIHWGQSGVFLTWEIHGGFYWYLWRNGTQIRSGMLGASELAVPIVQWQFEGWALGTYNLTLAVHDPVVDITVDYTSWVEVIYSLGDAYANEVVASNTYNTYYATDAVGAPNDLSARVFFDYGNGKIELDMGSGEEIIDGTGNDFIVHASGGTFKVYVRNKLDVMITYLGQGIGTAEFDISTSGLDTVRYVTVELYLGDFIDVDSIEAINYNTRTTDEVGPEIPPIGVVVASMDDLPVPLLWTPYDATPWSFEIFVDSIRVQASPWNGTHIAYNFTPESAGIYHILLVLSDLFGNNASDDVTVYVDVNPGQDYFPALVIGGITVSAIILLALSTAYRRRHLHSGGQ